MKLYIFYTLQFLYCTINFESKIQFVLNVLLFYYLNSSIYLRNLYTIVNFYICIHLHVLIKISFVNWIPFNEFILHFHLKLSNAHRMIRKKILLFFLSPIKFYNTHGVAEWFFRGERTILRWEIIVSIFLFNHKCWLHLEKCFVESAKIWLPIKVFRLNMGQWKFCLN